MDPILLGLEEQSAVLEREIDSAFTAENFSNLGSIATKQGFFEAADKYYQRSVDILKRLHGEDSVDVALATVPLAQLYGLYLHRFDEAIYLLDRALDVLVVSFHDQEDHPAIVEARDLLERVYTALENTRPSSRSLVRPQGKQPPPPQPVVAVGSIITGPSNDFHTTDYFTDDIDNVSLLSEDSLVGLQALDWAQPSSQINTSSSELQIVELAYQAKPHIVYNVMKSRPSSPETPQGTLNALLIPIDEFVKEMVEDRATNFSEDAGASGFLGEVIEIQKPVGETFLDLQQKEGWPQQLAEKEESTEDQLPQEGELQMVESKTDTGKQQKTLLHSQVAKLKGVVLPEEGSHKSGSNTGRSVADASQTGRTIDSRPSSADTGTEVGFGSGIGSNKKKRRKPGRKKGDIEEDDNPPPIDDDLVQDLVHKVEVNVPVIFPVSYARFEEDNTHLKYSVEYFELDPYVARTFMCRENEEAYLYAVGQTFQMPLFPPQFKGEVKLDYLQCARHVMSSRIQRLLLEDQIRELNERNQQFIDLLALCVKKKAAYHNRLLMLEKEMEHIAEEKQGNLVSPGSRFGAFLSTRAGWIVVLEFLTRECKRLQLPDDKRAVIGEAVNENLTIDDIFQFWDFMQMWQLLHSVFFRCKTGSKSYPIASKGPGPLIGGGARKASETPSSVEDDPVPPPIIIVDPSASIIAGRQAAMAAAPDEVLENSSVQDLADDNSSIASRPSVIRIPPSLAEVATNFADEDGSVASAPSKASEIMSAKTEKSNKKVEVEEKKSGGGWGFGFNLFGKKEEVKEVIATPVDRKLEPFVNGTGLGEWSEVCESLGCADGEISLLAAARQVVDKLGAKDAQAITENRHGQDENIDQEDQSQKERREQKERLNRILCGIVPLVLKTDIQVALEGMTSQDETNPFLQNAIKHVMDAVADHLEQLMLESLRPFPKWSKALEACRKDRVRRSGGRMDQNHDGEVELDQHGTIRIIPHADDIIDTDILHGSRQRIQVSIVMPTLEQRISVADKEEAKIRGELSCVVQFAYHTATPFIQRAIRGTLARMRKARERKDLVLYTMHAAAFSIQGRVRARQSRKNYARAKAEVIGDLRDEKCRILQRHLRGWTKRHKWQKYKADKKYRQWWFGLSMMQALIRGFNARHRVRRLKAGHKEDRQEEEKLWSIELIQRVGRGYIARKTIVRSLRIRKSISKRVLLLAEKYLQRGDLWNFLKEIDDEFARLGKEINQTKQREDEFADTFIEKVLQKRQGEFDGAWDRFGRSVTAQSSNRPAVGLLGNGENPSDNLTAVGNGNVIKAQWPSSSSSVATQGVGGPGGEASIPGPLLRRAVSATIQEGVQREVQRQRDGQERGIKLTEDIKGAYDEPTSRKPGRAKKGGKGGKPSLKSKSTSSLSQVNSGEALDGSKVSKEIEDAIRIKQKKKRKQQQPNNMSATTDNFMATAIVKETGNGYAERKVDEPTVQKGWNLETTKTGESLLVDIPKGINDTMERLLRSSALRCYVPDFFTGYDSSNAYKMYLMLPSGLAKMRYEQEAFRYCQPAVNQLRVKGINLIKDAMPAKRVRQFLVSVNTPTKLLDETMDNLFKLIKMGDVAVGIVHGPTSKKQVDISESKGTISQVLGAASSSLKSSPNKDKDFTNNATGPTIGTKSLDNSNSMQLDHSFASTDNIQSQETIGQSADEDENHHHHEDDDDDDRENAEGVDATLPSRLLLDMVEHGPWANMASSVDDIVMHAALLSVPFVRKRRNKYGVDVEKTSPWGHVGFKQHVKACQRATEDEKRELVRERFRACLLLTTPFLLRLKADGILKVQDLVETTDLRKLGMPPALYDQLEALMSTALSLSVSSKVVPTVRDHLSTSNEIFTVPMIFDPKFQRGPFDPYGRAPRIFPRLKLKKTKPGKRARPTDLKSSSLSSTSTEIASNASQLLTISGANESVADGSGKHNNDDNDNEVDDNDDDGDDSNAMPLGLWERKQKKTKKTLALAHAKKLFGFQSDVPMPGKHRKGDGVFEGVASISSTSQLLHEQESIGNSPVTEVASGPVSGTPLKQNRPRSKREMHERARQLKNDFEAHVRSGFERPYKCAHPGCDAAFSRAYSLKVHEKSHDLFGEYHKFRQQPQLFLDPDKEDVKAAARAAFHASVSLPPLVQQEIIQLRLNAAAKAWALTYDEQEVLRLEDNEPPSRPTTAQLFGPELVFTRSEAPALRAVMDLPVSRGQTPVTPSSPWRLSRAGSAAHSRSNIDSPISSRSILSRGGSRGGGSSSQQLTVTPWGDPPDTPFIGALHSAFFPNTPTGGGFPSSRREAGLSSFPNTPLGPLGSPSSRRDGASRGSVTWADQQEEEDDGVPLLSAPPIRFGVSMG